MNCPVCNNVQLVMTERQSVEIDYCPQCRGVWLDRGELDKIIERSAPGQRPPENRPIELPHVDKRHDQHYDKHYEEHGSGDYRRKKSFLSELFD
jgi:uncharacterized protein